MSQVEAEHYLKEAATVSNIRAKSGRLIQKATRYFRWGERQRKEEEKRRLEQTLNPINIQVAKMSDTQVSMARRAHQNLIQELDENSPPTEVSGATKDAAYKRAKELEAEITQGMLSREEMRRNPVGAVDRHIKWEKANKARILEWKNLKLLLNPESDEQDLCNVEQLRPSIAVPGQAPTFMPDAQIPGVFAMTPQAKANWPENMPEYGTVNSPLKQAEEREAALQKEVEELKAALANKEAKAAKQAANRETNREKSRERMKAYWEKRKAKFQIPTQE